MKCKKRGKREVKEKIFQTERRNLRDQNKITIKKISPKRLRGERGGAQGVKGIERSKSIGGKKKSHHKTERNAQAWDFIQKGKATAKL